MHIYNPLNKLRSVAQKCVQAQLDSYANEQAKSQAAMRYVTAI